MMMTDIVKKMYIIFDATKQEKYRRFKVKLVVFKMTYLMRLRHLKMGADARKRTVNTVRRCFFFIINVKQDYVH